MMRNVRESDRLVPLEGIGLLAVGDEGTNPRELRRLASEDRLSFAPGLCPAGDQRRLAAARGPAEQMHLPGGQVGRNGGNSADHGGFRVRHYGGTLPAGMLLAYGWGHKPLNLGGFPKGTATCSCVNLLTAVNNSQLDNI